MRARLVLVALAGLCVLAFAAVGASASAPVRVIVNPKNPATRVDKRFVADAFLKKRTHWDDDHPIQPVDLGQQSAVREQFSRDLLDRDVSSVRRYWAQLVFSGHGVPPPELGSESDVVTYVREHPGAIGYVTGAADVKSVKVLEVD